MPSRIVSLRPTRLDDVLDDVERVAAALGRPDRGATVRAELTARIADIARRARAPSPASPSARASSASSGSIRSCSAAPGCPSSSSSPAAIAVGATAGAPGADRVPGRARRTRAPTSSSSSRAASRCERALDERAVHRAPRRRLPRPPADLRHRRQRLLQPPRPAPRRVARDHGRVPPPRRVPRLPRGPTPPPSPAWPDRNIDTPVGHRGTLDRDSIACQPAAEPWISLAC